MTALEGSDLVKAYKAFGGDLLRNPDNTEALINQMALLSDNSERTNAQNYIYLARRAWRIAPDEINALFNYGSMLHRVGRFQEAADFYQKCLDKNDDNWRLRNLHHLGVAYRCMGENKKAIEFYEQALALDPTRHDIQKDLALAFLADGQWLRGLELFEVRKEVAYERLKWNDGKLITQARLPKNVVQWKGESLVGKSVVVYHEEGIGDFIQFCRFLPMLRGLGVQSIRLTGAAPDLLELIADNVAVDGIEPLAGPFECDYVVGSMSVPWRCGAKLEDVSGKPYFAAKPATFPLRGLLNVGLVWRGNAAYGMDAHRSLALDTLSPLFGIPNVAFYSLQVGEAVSEITKLGFDGFLADLAPFAKNWRATARLVKRLDAVVTVDTAVAHLAGALGVPVFILITNACDWRWDRNSMRSIWYDSAQVIRQYRQGDWNSCVAHVAMKLEDMADGRKQARSRDSAGAAVLCAAE
jgi:Tfp pilus assembly protein PilF